MILDFISQTFPVFFKSESLLFLPKALNLKTWRREQKRGEKRWEKDRRIGAKRGGERTREKKKGGERRGGRRRGKKTGERGEKRREEEKTYAGVTSRCLREMELAMLATNVREGK